MYTRMLLTGMFGFTMLATGCGAPAPGDTADTTQGLEQQDPPAKLHYAKGGGSHHGGTSSPDMTYGGGSVLTTNKTQAIFWGTSWSTYSGDKISGMDSFFSGFGGSNIEGIAGEYSSIQNSSTYLGHQLDTSAAPSRALSTSAAIAEACKMTGNSPDPSAVYFLFTDTGAGHVNYCAWHSWGTCSNGAQVQVAYMPNIDGLAGCDPSDTSTGHSEGLAALANVTSHELMEAITDPRGTGWTDSSGSEIGDKCAWVFNGLVTLANNTTWKLQMEWSNHAYDTNTGLPNLSGQNGCLQGN
jgi:hypothetical protein